MHACPLQVHALHGTKDESIRQLQAQNAHLREDLRTARSQLHGMQQDILAFQ